MSDWSAKLYRRQEEEEAFNKNLKSDHIEPFCYSQCGEANKEDEYRGERLLCNYLGVYYIVGEFSYILYRFMANFTSAMKLRTDVSFEKK